MAQIPGRGGAQQLVGRADELIVVRRSLDDTAAGRPAGVVLVGEGGVGKTRLISEMVARADQLGMVRAVGHPPISTAPAFGAIGTALRSWLRTHPLSEPLAPFDRGLQRVLPEWPITDSDDERGDALLATEAVLQLVQRITATHGPMLFVVDDLHLADPESIETLRYLVAASLPGVAVVTALRPQESRDADALLRAWRAEPSVVRVDVAPLAPLEVAELIEAMLGTSPPDELVADVVARTDGVPLLVEEVVRGHLEAGSIVIDGPEATWHSVAGAVPPSVRELVQDRLESLSSSEREILVAGAAIGDFEPATMRAVSGGDDAQIAAAIGAGVRIGLVEVGGHTAAFRHAILREAVLDGAVPQLVDAIHRRAVAALATRHDAASLERRARHLEALGDRDAAAATLCDAAGLLRLDHLLLGAEQVARRADALARAEPVRAAIADELARILAAQGRWVEALALDEATIAVHGDNADRRLRRIESALDAGLPDTADATIALGRQSGDDSLTFHLARGRAAMVRGQARTALTIADDVLARDGIDVDVRLGALDLRGRACDYLGDRTAATEAWSRQAREAATARRTRAQLRAVVQLGKIELFAGMPPARLVEAVDLARAAGALVELAWAQENLAIGLGTQGRIAESLAIIDDAIERCRLLQLDQLAYLLSSKAMAESFRGGSVETLLTEAEAITPTPDLRFHTVTMRGQIALRRGAYPAAIAALEESCELARSMPGVVPMSSVCWLPWAYAAVGRIDDAVRALTEAEAVPDLARFHSRPVVVALARVLLDDDANTLDRALNAVPEGMPSDHASMLVLSAEIVGDPHRLTWLRSALRIYETMGATADAEHVARLVRAAGGRAGRPHAPAIGVPEELAARGVTAREYEVLARIGRGLPNAEIADELYVSVRTVESHVSSLLRKLDARNRAELAARHG